MRAVLTYARRTDGRADPTESAATIVTRVSSDSKNVSACDMQHAKCNVQPWLGKKQHCTQRHGGAGRTCLVRGAIGRVKVVDEDQYEIEPDRQVVPAAQCRAVRVRACTLLRARAPV